MKQAYCGDAAPIHLLRAVPYAGAFIRTHIPITPMERELGRGYDANKAIAAIVEPDEPERVEPEIRESGRES